MMGSVQYPTIPVGACGGLIEDRTSGNEPDIGAVVEISGSGDSVAMARIADASAVVANLREDRGVTKRDSIEGRAAIVLYEAVEKMPAIALNDPGFWRYLALGYTGFWDFAAWRHQEQLGAKGFRKYVDAQSPRECVVTRMYLRVRALHGDGDAEREYRELAAAVETDAVDFWRSHIVRVRTGKSSAVARAFARMQRDHALPTKKVREFAKVVNRIHANVVTAIYDEEEADAFIYGLREEFDREGEAT